MPTHAARLCVLRARAHGLHALEVRLRRRAKGGMKVLLGGIAAVAARGCDVHVAPPINAKQWAKRSPLTAHALNLGKLHPRMALTAVRQGTAMPGGVEQGTSKKCSACADHRKRGSALLIRCAKCGTATMRDLLHSPVNIAGLVILLGLEARDAYPLAIAARKGATA